MKKLINRIINQILMKLRFKLYNIIKVTEGEIIQNKLNDLRSKISVLGENLRINGEITITEPRMLSIGSNVHIGDNAYFNTAGGLIIGDNVHFSRNITIYTSSHNYEGGLPYDQQLITKKVIIRKNAWIGMNVSITSGVIIGKGAIIGMGSVITKDVPDYAVVGNQPYRILKTRNLDNYELLEQKKKIGGINGKLINHETSHLATGKELGNKLFFIVSTGRSGTMSIAHILNQHPQINCKHEITDILISLSTQYMHGEVSYDVAKSMINEMYCDAKVFPKEMWFGESNPKISTLIPIIHELLPEVKFIWLIRDGKKVVDSTSARGWYINDNTYNSLLRNPDLMIWDNYRLMGNKTGDFSDQEWQNMNLFEKNCWYWVKWNTIIEQGLTLVPQNQKYYIKLEELNQNLGDLCNFLGLPDHHFNVTKKNQAKQSLKGVDNWSDNECVLFNKYCSEYYNKHYL